MLSTEHITGTGTVTIGCNFFSTYSCVLLCLCLLPSELVQGCTQEIHGHWLLSAQ